MLRGLKKFNLPEIEEKILKFWKESKIFEKSVALRKTQGKKPFKFFEGPPTANGLPAMHHVLARVFKDIVLRYKTMAGYYVERRAGWDTHGLPVEIGVEKELGIKNKQGIEKFGIAEFNMRAKMSAWKYKSDWEKLTERIGFWLDFDNAYITYDNKYIETLWWIFSEIAKKGLLKKLYKIVPWCPRCQTPLSSHELGLPGAYKKTKDPSIYVKFALRQAQGKRAKTKEFLLVWTTTPWTLPANVAVAVNPGLTYTKYKVGDEYLWSSNIPPEVGGKKIEIIEKISGKKLVGVQYEALYPAKNKELKAKNLYAILAADFVSTEEGTGLVHIAPAFGEDDLNLVAQTLNIEPKTSEIPITIDDRGMVKKMAGWRIPGAGKFIKDADKDIVADLGKRGLLHHFGFIEHEYPFCWRCSAPLIYFARDSWFILMSQLRDKLLAANKKISWIPEHIKEGRFGEWLRELKDWAVSRERYWGTPLPIWEHEKGDCHRRLFVKSLDDLNKYSFFKNRYFLVRHTESNHNIQNVCASGSEHGKPVSRLTKNGIKQAGAMAQELKKKKVDIIFSSPYFRTKETAKIISKITGAKMIFDKRIVELNTGVFDGRPVNEHKKFFSEPIEEFYKRPPGGEHLGDVKKRMLDFVRDINSRYQGKNIVIVSHGDPLWVLAGGMRGLSNEEILKSRYPQCGTYQEADLYNWPMNQDGDLDLHRPSLDAIYLRCPARLPDGQDCGEKMVRVKEVADVWFDSGAMPFAQQHYPFENKTAIDGTRAESAEAFPADYIAEGIDQTRGWFYTLLAISVLLGRGAPYHNVIALGLLLDKNGQKMSKSKGNIVEPWPMIQKYGADVIRWYFYTVNPPGEPKRFDENDLRKTFNQLFLLLYNSFVFYNTYGEQGGDPIKVLDKWIIARLHQTVEAATAQLEKYEIGEAAKAIEELVDDVSRWYIRRSRKNVSPQTLSLILTEISKLMAPFAPFFADSLYLSLVNSHKPSSVHLADWPIADKKLIDKDLLGAMAEVRRLTSLALAEREKAGIKVRQPLALLRIKNKELGIKKYEELLGLLKDEVNVKEVVFGPTINPPAGGEIELDTKITPELREEGLMRELTRLIQGLRHDANCHVKDRIQLYLELPKDLKEVVEKHLAGLKKQVNLKSVEFKKSDKFDAELKYKIEDVGVWIGLKK